MNRKGFGMLEMILVLVVGLGLVYWQMQRAQKTTAQLNQNLSGIAGSDPKAPVSEQLKVLQSDLNKQADQTNSKAECALDSTLPDCQAPTQ
jgi:uncharacterized protein HemX